MTCRCAAISARLGALRLRQSDRRISPRRKKALQGAGTAGHAWRECRDQVPGACRLTTRTPTPTPTPTRADAVYTPGCCARPVSPEPARPPCPREPIAGLAPQGSATAPGTCRAWRARHPGWLGGTRCEAAEFGQYAGSRWPRSCPRCRAGTSLLARNGLEATIDDAGIFLENIAMQIIYQIISELLPVVCGRSQEPAGASGPRWSGQ